MGGPSSQEQQLQQEQSQQTAQYIAQQNTLFSEQQDLLNTMKPILENEINNPVGFSAAELADLNASNVNTTGAQYANVQKQLNLRNASENMAGLTSGVSAAETAALQGAAAGTVATNATNVQLQSEQLAQAKSAAAQQELLGLESGVGGQSVSIGQVENTSQSNAFNQAYQEQQQSSQLMSGILGGLMNVGLTAATGGVSGMLTGGTFLSGAGNALSGGQGGF